MCHYQRHPTKTQKFISHQESGIFFSSKVLQMSFFNHLNRWLNVTLITALFQDILIKCNGTCAEYLFQPDKIYDVSYDVGEYCRSEVNFTRTVLIGVTLNIILNIHVASYTYDKNFDFMKSIVTLLHV